MSFAMHMESLPPEMQTAILSPGWISSYRFTAVMNGVHSSFRYFFSRLCSTFWWYSIFRAIVSLHLC